MANMSGIRIASFPGTDFTAGGVGLVAPVELGELETATAVAWVGIADGAVGFPTGCKTLSRITIVGFGGAQETSTMPNNAKAVICGVVIMDFCNSQRQKTPRRNKAAWLTRRKSEPRARAIICNAEDTSIRELSSHRHAAETPHTAK